MISMVWLAAAAQSSWVTAPMLLSVATLTISVVGPLNLVSILLVREPSIAWQKFSGVGITASFPKPVLPAFKKLVDDDLIRSARSMYTFSLDMKECGTFSAPEQRGASRA
jgi:hypothetical protein